MQPTNHLDLHAVLWLSDYLVTWPGTLVVVSHARAFLDAVCTDIVLLQHRTLTTYKGDVRLLTDGAMRVFYSRVLL